LHHVSTLGEIGWFNYVFVKGVLPKPQKNARFIRLDSFKGVLTLMRVLLFTRYSVYCVSFVSNYLLFIPLIHARRRRCVVSLRNTDINYYQDKFRCVFWLIEKVQNLTNVKFHILNNSVLRRVGLRAENTITLPNGLDKFWIRNVFSDRRENKKFLFVGRLDNNKNILNLVELFKMRIDLELTVVGDGPLFGKVFSATQGSANMKVLGRISNKEELMKLYRESTSVIVLSRTESFGLVYLEALSQGCNIIYTKGQGFDGWLGDGLGQKGFESDISLVEGELDRMSIWQSIDINTLSKYLEEFEWGVIGLKWSKLYE
jgi:glycosyltransferase involved in cell wall biosynthesis